MAGSAIRQAPSDRWPREAVRRITTLWWLKAAGTTLYMWMFFQCYFYLLQHQAYPVTVIPTTALDKAIPFSPAWVLVYFSLWIYVSLPGALQANWSSLFWHGVAALLMCAIGLACYYWYPTTFVQQGTDWSQMPPGRLLQSVDRAGNVFPSMHVAFAVFAWAWLRRALHQMRAPRWPHVANALWCIAISYSTLATKQHVAWDVIAGCILGMATGVATARAADWLQGRRRHALAPL
ncbi:MAG: hypothetical protein OJF60_000975 [Burkholderiaceae bacterium]|jgi:hypothetical protein|nr:MAG: hypothetical protein OJF60_000975 [Burkholderiaceae bacterium]